MTTLAPTCLEDVAAAVRERGRIVPHGRLTKKPLVSENADAVRLNMTGLTGVSEYEPGEFTFTARAGTPLSEIEALLAAHGQYMPFDPPLAEDGATIGGALAAGLNGPGRLRYGGLRDFVIGVRFVDGTGTHVRGGGKVVKNAAGFDLPRLMVGSMGRLGVITELTFKVFPAPRAWRTLLVSCRDLADAVARIAELGRRPLELEALELEPPATLIIRVAGDEAALNTHVRRVGDSTGRPYEVIAGEEEASYWRAQRAFAWVEAGHRLIKVPVTLRGVAQLDEAAERQEVPRRYGVAGNVAWLAWPPDRPLGELDLVGYSGLVVRGPRLHGVSPWLGPPAKGAVPFARRIKQALDPERRLPELV
jgi:glycolate oxidase FAD binding subunit